jgi:hypothetical protein
MNKNQIVITPDALASIGRAAFGELWQNAMARALDIEGRTVRRWSQDGAPDWPLERLREIIAAKRKECDKAEKILSRLANRP